MAQLNRFTEQAKQVLALAEQQARSLNHHYIGTEHVLLALLEQKRNVAADALRALGIEASTVRAEIERQITRGRAPILNPKLPLTPRVAKAIAWAAEEARFGNQENIDSEHLLLGLLREDSGVAGLVLRHLGLELGRVREEVLKIRILQMKVVERVVRSLRTITPRKRRIRKELLAHLETIYEEEQARLNDPAAAVKEAALRFGDPAELARQLENALPATERLAYYLERWFGWRPPESAERYLLRLTALSLLVYGAVLAQIIAIVTLCTGWHVWAPIIPATEFFLLIAFDQYFLGLLYFKMRDALLGPVWSSRSVPRVVVFEILSASIVFASGFSFIAVSGGGLSGAIDRAYVIAVAAVGIAFGMLLHARYRGPTEISDTMWACLDV
jgi:Clp amino terminal domain, pathogenicity island component